ncbi:unnamed protein product [Symbiodinium natans]|uniref:Uncharacterized protein n=1 Tax=Symbiodinium natans TaxID=878477 RepID=A0A812N869_9DINO|nr:unnamed protein product [Symbiodinium natans]
MSGILLGDTQLVESINSIIKLISTRCAKIDIASLSARVILKKASAFARAGSAFRSAHDDTISKRWSAIKSRAFPILQDMIAVGQDYKVAMNAADRFRPTDTMTLRTLHASLGNTNLAAALPELKQALGTVAGQLQWLCSMQDAKFKWVANAVVKWHKASKAFMSSDAVGSLWSAVASTVLYVKTPSESNDLLALQAASHRSHDHMVLLKTTHDGRLEPLLDERGLLQFSSSPNVFRQCYATCQDEESTICLMAMRVLYQEKGLLGWLDSADQLPALQDVGAGVAAHRDIDSAPLWRPWRPYNHAALAGERDNNFMQLTVKQRAGDEDAPDTSNAGAEGVLDEEGQRRVLENHEDVNAGYGLGDDSQEASEEMAAGLFEDADAVDSANAATIKAAAGVMKSRADGGTSNADLRKIEQASEMLSNTLAQPSGLTGAELEEEALLLLIRQHNAQAQDAGVKRTSQDATAASSNPKRLRGTDYSDLLKQFENKMVSSDEDEADDSDFIEDAEDDAVARTSESAATISKVSLPAEATQGRQQQQPLHRPSTYKKAYKLWHEAFAETISAIDDAAERGKLPIGHADEISVLVRLPQGHDTDLQLQCYELVYVKWVNAAEREGRLARVDAANSVVWSPASLFGRTVPTEVFDLARYQCLISAAGACSRRVRGSGTGELRDQLPSTVCRFVNFLKVAIMHANEDCPDC